MSIYSASVKKPISTILIFVGIIVFGLFSYTRLSVDLLPDFESNQLTVMCSYPGASASDVETNVTKLLEDGLNTVDKLKEIKSISKENFSIVSLEFDWGTDLDVATNDVRDKIELFKSSLPDGAMSPTIFKFSTNMIPIMQITVSAKESLPALYKILDTQVANAINRIEGVGSVSISGAPQRQIQVNVDPRKIEAYNLSVDVIGRIISAENKNVPGGSFDIGSDSYSLRVEGEFTESDQLKEVIVGSYNGRNIYLKDIATVKDTLQDKLQEAYINGVQGAYVVIVKQSGANTIQIVEDVRKALPDIQKSLPPDIKLSVFSDTSENIEQSIDSLFESVMYAFLFVVLVVLAFLGRWRATFIIILTIPVSLIVSFAYLMVAGESLNIITLSSLSIAIGMVVDDAIVVLENITTHIERGSPPKQAAIYGTNEVGVAVIATTLTVVAVFFPLTMVGGMAGLMFKPLGWMVTIIILFSTLTALTLTPMLSSRLLRLNPKNSKWFDILYKPVEKTLDKLDAVYEKFLTWALMHKKVMLGSSIAIFVSSIFLFSLVGSEFFPASDNGMAWGKVSLKTGTRVEITKDVANGLVSKWKQKYPELENVVYTAGIPDDNNIFASISQNGNEYISFNFKLTRPTERERSAFTILDSMRADLDLVPEIVKYELGIGNGKSGGFGGGNYVDLEIYGYDFNTTSRIANELRERIRKNVPGAADVLISREDFKPEYRVEFDRAKLSLNGLNLATAAVSVRNSINGLTASKYREDGDEYDIIVRFEKEARTSLEDIQNIVIYNGQGKGVKVSEIGHVIESYGPPTIERKNRERMITVSTAVSGVPMNVVVEGVNKELAQMDIPGEIGVKLAGSAQDQQESNADMVLLLGLVILLVYIVMASQFESFVSPFIIMLALPFAFSGVFFALWITNTTLSMTSMIGAIMLVGIVVKNGIVLVDFINLQRERGQSVFKAVVTSGKSRLRPVLMTTLTTILGMVPLAISQGQGAEMWRPMAIAIIGGLTVSTVLTLVIVPVAYAISYTFFTSKVNKTEEHRRRMLEKEADSVEF